jgi:hypothetical protein
MDEKQALKSRKELFSFLLFGGIVLLVFGGVHFFSYLRTGAGISLSDAAFNGLAGVVSLCGAWLVSKGKFLVILVVLFYVLAGLAYAYLVGRGFNYFVILFGVILIPWMYLLRKNGALS